jgi:RNA polymerase sigma-70 factor, ECF subfamily
VTSPASGRARFAQPALVNGVVGAVWAPGGRPRVVFAFTIAGGKVVEINLVADLERLRRLNLAILTSNSESRNR